MHRHRGVAEHGFRSGRRDGETNRRILFKRVFDRVQFPFDIFVLDFDVGEGGEAAGTPVDQPLSSIDQSFLMQSDEDFQDGF